MSALFPTFQNKFESSLYTNMDRSQHLSFNSSYKKAIEIETGTLHNFTNLKHMYFEKVPINQLFENIDFKNETTVNYTLTNSYKGYVIQFS